MQVLGPGPHLWFVEANGKAMVISRELGYVLFAGSAVTRWLVWMIRLKGKSGHFVCNVFYAVMAH